MSDWVAGYRRALLDVAVLAHERALPMGSGWRSLFEDLEGDALVIEREQDNRMRSRRLRAQREALPLFEDAP